MVLNFFSFFGSELKSVTQSAAVLALAGILADVLSLFRDRLLASEFGASRALDIYYASFRIPDFIYTFSLFFAASTALIPIILDKFSGDKKNAEEFFGNIFSLFGLATIFLVVVGFFLIPSLIPYFTPGFSLEEQREAINLSRILLLSPLFLGLSNLVSSVIQSFRRFYVYAASPLFYNLGIIIGILFFMPRWGLAGIVWGVVLGAFLHFAVQLPTVFSLGFSLRPRLPKISSDVLRSLKLSLPRTLGLSLNQLVLSVITAMASTLGAGAVAVFNFATNLQSVPLSVIGLSYSVSAFPTLAASYARNGTKDFLDHFSLALRHIFFWSLPATILFIVLRAQIVRVILGAGAFSWVDTRLTAAALFLLSLSILSQGLLMLYVRAFYAAGHTYLPLRINLVSSAMTLFFAKWFLDLFRNSFEFREWFLSILRVSDIGASGILILPLAISLGSIINLLLLIIFFKKSFKMKEISPGISRSLRDSVLASIFLGGVTYASLRFFAGIFNLDTFIGIFLQGFLSAILGISAGALILLYLKNQEFHEFYEAFKDRVWRKTVVVTSEPEKLP
ncbi:hypothetical protein A3B18_02510 [Candidatus Giovannonibacteria bacterium RIFCSPLOWO2_01_FULL_46_13]|uniref:Probable lipid II flippase MurJ n=1 Tax=Candidatus Giovannonibacteria bacterium RIFCSPLOWO2_01_FULL_46_13 TaxID=1798352 RepID=A0A1F5X655_9BACT|nr:MAG: hypothetical protein A3B18_02510 [Candidatus Giovannonibacteria bacterium RIFCSPLOWO2_01_FULL_46_13]